MHTVLFVDDERRVLSALERVLRPERHRWGMSFAENAELALGLLAQARVDVIVTDVRMPGIDGVKLLERVRELYPTTARIILSGQPEPATYRRAVEVAHIVLEKPCPRDVLVAAIERMLA